jgi:TolA-binding protein
MPEVAGTVLEGQVKLFKGQILERNKQYDEAIKIYQDLQKTMPVKFRVDPVMRMAYAFEAKGDAGSLENAYKKFQEVVIIFSGSTREAEALYKAGEVARRLKKDEDASKVFTKLQRDFPNSKWAALAKSKGFVK